MTDEVNFELSGEPVATPVQRELTGDEARALRWGYSTLTGHSESLAPLVSYLAQFGDFTAQGIELNRMIRNQPDRRHADVFMCNDCTGLFDLSGGGTNAAINERCVCGYCLEQRYCYCESEDIYAPSNDCVQSHDSDNYATRRYANRNWFRSEDGYWYENPDNAPEYQVDFEDDDDRHDDDEDPMSDDYGRLEYSADVIRVLGWPTQSPKDALVFGVELEMEGRDNHYPGDVVNRLPTSHGRDDTGRFILKSDGSLRDGGVELVTLPFTMDYHRTKFGWDTLLDRNLQRVARSGSDTRACGMHVHINRAALSALQIGKMLVFANSSLLSSYITLIAQREQTTYCERSKKKLTDGSRRGENRYDILNCGNNKTVEVRMFRGNLRADRVLKNIEFCHALAVYCKDASAATIESWSVFAKWLIERRGQYPNLCKFLHEAGVREFQHLVFKAKPVIKEAA